MHPSLQRERNNKLEELKINLWQAAPILFNRIRYSGDYTQTIGQWAVFCAAINDDLETLQLLLNKKAADLAALYGSQGGSTRPKKLGDSILESLRCNRAMESDVACFLLNKGFKTRFM